MQRLYIVFHKKFLFGFGFGFGFGTFGRSVAFQSLRFSLFSRFAFRFSVASLFA
jgi:hypothetical protein